MYGQGEVRRRDVGRTFGECGGASGCSFGGGAPQRPFVSSFLKAQEARIAWRLAENSLEERS